MIRMTQAIAGPGISVSAGTETDAFSKEEESRLIEAGFAEAVKPKAKPKPRKTESASVSAKVETATAE